MNTHKLLTKIGTVLAIGAIGITTIALADGGEGKGHRGRGRGMGMEHTIEKMADKLGLTADQKTRIQAIRDQFQKNNAAALAEIKQLHEQMKTYAKDKNREQMKALREQIHTKMEALKPAREQMHQQILAVLTAEQRAKIDQMKADRQEKREERKGDRKERRDQRRQQGDQGKVEIN